MDRLLSGVALALSVIALVACGSDNTQLDHGALSAEEAAAAVSLPCLDINDDNLVSAQDAAPLSGGGDGQGRDFDASGSIDERDAAFLEDVSLALDPNIDPALCEGEAPIEFLVGGDGIDCDEDEDALIILGVAGGVADLRQADDGAGVRFMVNRLTRELEEAGVTSLAVIAGPAAAGVGDSLHGGMESWLTSVMAEYFERFPCAGALFLGHSHGAVTTDVVAARLEDSYGDRIRLVIALDRIDDLYFGDVASMPQTVDVLNIYETNDNVTSGSPREGANAENWNASGELGPSEGEEGGELEPVTHSTIDNSEAVLEGITPRVLEAVR